MLGRKEMMTSITRKHIGLERVNAVERISKIWKIGRGEAKF